MSERYFHSEQMLERALKVIPLGSQTFSKSKTQYPHGVSPFFIEKGLGSRVWDVDGNEFIDFINSLAAITLGYQDPDVTEAVREQLSQGTIFSQAHPVEVSLAEKLVELIPCAEMVRYGKNGSDATAGAIRLARAYTKRDHVAVCGYHGWQDWYIGSTARHLGVPAAVRNLTHTFAYNDLESLNKIFRDYPDQVATVILEPMNTQPPGGSFLQELKELTHMHGALLIFDETITGFRFAKGGAQELFGVTPDLASFGKGMGNGFPISAVVGKAEYMKMMEEIFFSFTFGGETLSLAAALATINKMERVPVLEMMAIQGRKLLDEVNVRTRRAGIDHILSVGGHPTWSFLHFKDAGEYSVWEIRTLFLQEMFARGILILGTHNMSYAHSDQDIARLLSVYDEVFPIIKEAVDQKKLGEFLRCKPIEPLFKVR